MGLLNNLLISLKHRGQPEIQQTEGEESHSREKVSLYNYAYKKIAVVNRGVNIIVDSASKIGVSVNKRLGIEPRTLDLNDNPKHIRQKLLETLLTFYPNPFENIDEFHRQLYMDLLLEGNCFQYFDGKYLWHFPAQYVTIVTDSRDKIKHYEFGNQKYSINEIIHTKDNSSESVYRGASRLSSAIDAMRLIEKMMKFQENFFDNGGVPGLILVTENVLGDKIKNRMMEYIKINYNALKKGRLPLILDANLRPHNSSDKSFKELDFTESKKDYKQEILEALGVPKILLESGNNANISPNIRLLYELTILPLADKLIASYELFFGYDLEPDVFKIRALRPDLREAGSFFSSMVNNGIITINEARRELRLEPSAEKHANELRIPQNITGSATDSSQGGRPPEDNEDDDNE